MTRVLVLFFDGLGLGKDDPGRNPLAAANMPVLESLLEGKRLLTSAAPFEGKAATLLSLDARLGVPGTPQSATGQAVLLTGRNIPAEIGEHYGPKPNPAIASILQQDNLFFAVRRMGATAALINAYPPGYFKGIESGLRLYSAIPLAITAAGFPLKNAHDLQAGLAISADFTGAGWASQPDFPPTPLYTPRKAGALLAKLAQDYDLTWFDYWLSDYAGHRWTHAQAVDLLESFDLVLGGLLDQWALDQDLIVLVSDHGNLEDQSARGHTLNTVPALIIGPEDPRALFARDLSDLTGFMHAILAVLSRSPSRLDASPSEGYDDSK
jgi:hypothetical protein